MQGIFNIKLYKVIHEPINQFNLKLNKKIGLEKVLSPE